jgi:hypothetical protein
MHPAQIAGKLVIRKTQTVPHTLESAFKAALENFRSLQTEIGFNELCHERSVDLTDTGHRHYWAAVADYAAIQSEEAEDNGLPERVAILNELIASTPDYIFKQDFLDRHSHDHGDHHAVHEAKEVASYYNGLLRLAAEDWPDLTVASLLSSLTEATRAIGNHHIRAQAPNQLVAAIRGAQHEVVFGQLLEHTDRTYHKTSLHQDLKGVDYTVANPEGREQYIDVKTSMHDIVKYGGNFDRPYVVEADDHLIVYSLVHDDELNGNFYLPDDLAARHGARLQRLLDEALLHGRSYRRKFWHRRRR